MSISSTCGLVLAVAAAAVLSAPARASQPYLFVDETAERLPPEELPDPAGTNPDTLDVELRDLDGDGDLDAWFGEGSASTAGFVHKVFINDGTGVFSDESSSRFNLPNIAGNTSEVEFADVDCDGDLDAAVSNLTIFQEVAPGFIVVIAGANELWFNDGSGFFTLGVLPQRPTPPFPSIEVAPGVVFLLEISSELQFVDADGDGDPDLLIANENPFDPTSGGQNRFFLNSGLCTGSYLDRSEDVLPFPLVDQTQGFRPADVDGDGDIDLVVIGAGPNYLLRNQWVETGGLGFVQEHTIGPASANVSSTRNAILADLDDDGNLDLVEANSRNEENGVYFGDGTGAFTHAPGALPPDAMTNTDVDAADLDSDGDVDLYFTGPGGFLSGHGFEGAPDRFYVNDGNGFFAEATFPSFSERVTTSTDSAFGDVDGDGDLDLLVAASGLGPVGDPSGALDRLYINHGCDVETAFCLASAVAGLDSEVGGLSTAPYPEGDMTSGHVLVNELRKVVLQLWVESLEQTLAQDRLFAIALALKVIEWRVDGRPLPSDWVAGEAADRILAWVAFADYVLVWW